MQFSAVIQFEPQAAIFSLVRGQIDLTESVNEDDLLITRSKWGRWWKRISWRQQFVCEWMGMLLKGYYSHRNWTEPTYNHFRCLIQASTWNTTTN